MARLREVYRSEVTKALIERFGYDEQSATDVLNYVASIFARGDTQKEGG